MRFITHIFCIYYSNYSRPTPLRQSLTYITTPLFRICDPHFTRTPTSCSYTDVHMASLKKINLYKYISNLLHWIINRDQKQSYRYETLYVCQIYCHSQHMSAPCRSKIWVNHFWITFTCVSQSVSYFLCSYITICFKANALWVSKYHRVNHMWWGNQK